MPMLKTGTILPDAAEELRIQAGIAVDPDTYELLDPVIWAKMRPLAPRGRPKAEVTKERISVRLSAEVTQYFRATGKGWQTRMDEVLKAYVEQQRSSS